MPGVIMVLDHVEFPSYKSRELFTIQMMPSQKARNRVNL